MGELKGQLSQGAMPEVLRQVYVGRWTGTLHFDSAGKRRSLRFRRGHIINAITSIPEDHLGETMVRHGLITSSDLQRATEMVRSGSIRLGEALHEMGAITPSQLEDGIALHIRQILLGVFEWNDGEWTFVEEDEEASLEAPVLKLSAGELILEAVRRIDDPDVIRFQLGDIDRRLALSSDPLLRFQKLTLTPTDGFVLSRVDGTCSIREVVQMIPLPTEETERSLFGLICTGIVECLAAPEKKPQPLAPRNPPRRPEPTHRSEPVRESSPPPAPAAPAQVAPPRPSPPASPGPQTAAVRTSEPSPTDAGTAQAFATVAATPEAVARRREVMEAFEALKSRTHFETLELPDTATDAQLKEAYFRLAKRFHPDSHHDPTLADLHDQIEAIFIRLGEAYEVLRNPRMRAAYEEALRSRRTRPTAKAATGPAAGSAEPIDEGPSAEERARTAQEAVLKASRFYEAGQYWDAIQSLEPAIPRLEGRVRSRGRVLLARCLLKNPHWVRRGEEMLLDVTREDPKYPEAWFSLSLIYKDRGLKARAVSMLQKVVELKPDHDEARALLAEVGPPPDETPDETGGLMKRLFRKG